MDTPESFISDSVEQSTHSDRAAVPHPFRKMSRRNTSAVAETAFGVILMVMQTCMSLYGVTLQRLSHVRMQEAMLQLHDASSVEWYQRPRAMWWIGFSLFLSSQFIVPMALAFAPMSLLAPLSSVQMLINLVLAHFILHETISKGDMLATAACTGFSVGVLIFGPKKDDAVTPYITDVVANISDAGMLFVLSVIIMTAIALTFYIIRGRLQMNWQRSKYFIMPWLHCSLAAFGMLFTKCIGEQLLALEDNDTGLWVDPIMHLFITVLLMCSCSPISMLKK
jgi:hypothetical protein